VAKISRKAIKLGLQPKKKGLQHKKLANQDKANRKIKNKVLRKKEKTNNDFPNQVLKTQTEKLIEYQNSLKNTLNNLASCLSLLLIIVGLYLLVNGLFGIVNKNSQNQILVIPTGDNINMIEGNITGIDNLEELPGRIDEGGLFVERVKAESSTSTMKAMATEKEIAQTHKWKATDYEKGDIGIGSYQVKQGDTLWEIAEAVYGDGFRWTKILEDNKNNIGFLPDGSQALIMVGQVLDINK